MNLIAFERYFVEKHIHTLFLGECCCGPIRAKAAITCGKYIFRFCLL